MSKSDICGYYNGSKMALAMSQHRRLGEASPLNRLDTPVLEKICDYLPTLPEYGIYFNGSHRRVGGYMYISYKADGTRWYEHGTKYYHRHV